MSCGNENNISVNYSGPLGPQGAQGVQGVQGDTGSSGPQGSRGNIGYSGFGGVGGVQGRAGKKGKTGKSSMIAFCKGKPWEPQHPYYNSLRDATGNSINFGKVTIPSGEYIFHLALNIRWAGVVGGGIYSLNPAIPGISPAVSKNGVYKQGCFSLQEGFGNSLVSIPWAQEMTGDSGYGYSVANSYSHYVKTSIIGGKELFVTAEEAQSVPLETRTFTYSGRSMKITVMPVPTGAYDAATRYKLIWEYTPLLGSENIGYGVIYWGNKAVVVVNGQRQTGVYLTEAVAWNETIKWAPFVIVSGSGSPEYTSTTSQAISGVSGAPKNVGAITSAQLAIYTLPQYVI